MDFYLLTPFSLQLLTLPSSTLCCPFVVVASQLISPPSAAVRLSSSCQVGPSFPAPSLLSQARMRTGLSGVNRHSDGGLECMTSVGSNPNILLRQGSWECELCNSSDGRYWQVFGLGESWLGSHWRNDSSCKIILFPCKVKYFVQNVVQEEVRHICYGVNSLYGQPKIWNDMGVGVRFRRCIFAFKSTTQPSTPSSIVGLWDLQLCLNSRIGV